MKKCTLTFDMWLHSCDDECPTFGQIGEGFENCGTCKWYKKV